jgi:DNA-directed RNA polymerase specialized sigma24 family protein
MPVDSETMQRARKLRPGAVEEVLRSQVTSVYRLSYALAGRWDVGRDIARFVLNRSVKMMPKWDPEDDPANWYHRFTVMTSRRSAKHKPAAKNDVLVEQALAPDRPYIAFVAALRQLEYQPREALLLRHGEKLNGRYSALAMDCSTSAAENHLRVAEDSLKLVAGGEFEPMLRKMIDAYAHLTPEAEHLLPTVSGVVLRQVLVRRWIRWLWKLLQLGILAALIWGGWRVYRIIQT